MAYIRPARFPKDAGEVLDIFCEYLASPSVDLCYQNNAAELADLPGKYASPAGCVLLGWTAERVVGCVAMRPVDQHICEMKKLYVRPEARGTGLGRGLITAVLNAARTAAYHEIRLDVLPEFTAARALYAEFGFAPAAPVTFNPVPGSTFLGLALDPA